MHRGVGDRTVAYTIDVHIAWQRGGDVVVLVNLDSAVAVGLNPVASVIFPMLEDHDEKSIVAAIVREFEVNPSDAREDLRGFVAQMMEQQMLYAEESTK